MKDVQSALEWEVLNASDLLQLPGATVVSTDGAVLYSWRFFLCMTWEPVRRDAKPLTAPWDDSAYAADRSMRPPWFCFRDDGKTSLMAVVGPGTAFDSGAKKPIRDLDAPCIVLTEVFPDSVHWMEPGDLDVRRLPERVFDGEQVSPSSDLRDGFILGWSDGAVRRLDSRTPMKVLAPFLAIETAKAVSRDVSLSAFVLAKVEGHSFPDNPGPSR